jgi:hypothetical protein
MPLSDLNYLDDARLIISYINTECEILTPDNQYKKYDN